MSKNSRLLYLVALLLGSVVEAGITFSSDDAKLKLVNSGVKLNVATGLTITNGTLQKIAGTSLTGVSVSFSNGTLIQDNMPVNLFGSSTLATTNIFALNGSDTFDVQTTASVQGITVSGNDNLISGQPFFYGTNAISLQDGTTTVSLAIQAPVSKKVVLNNGKIHLANDLSLGDNGSFSGAGSVVFNGYRLSLGGKTSVWTSTVRMVRAQDLQLNSDVLLAGQMIFDGDATVNGNGNALDLTYGGTIRIKPNSTVSFSNVKIRGLHKYGQNGTGTGGSIVFDANSSSMHLDQSELELNSNYTFTLGGIYVESASSVMVKNFFLTFDRYSTLTVDGTTLTYEPIGYQDQNNIVNSGSSINFGNSGRTSTLATINSGSVRTVRIFPSSYTFAEDTTLGVHIVLTPSKTASVTGNVVLDGNNFFIYFGRATSSPLITVSAGKTLEFRNVVLWNFSPSHISLGAGAQVIFGTGTTIELGQNEIMPSSNLTNLRFQGVTTLNGKGQYLDLGNTASITVAGYGSSLLLENITLKNLGGTKLRTLSSASTVSLREATLKLQTTYTFTQGHLEVVGDSRIVGEKIFSFETPQTSTIHSRSMLTIDTNTTFSYSPKGSNRNDLIWMPDATSIMFFNGTTLKTTTTGIQFTRGTVLVDGRVNFYNDGASVNNLRQGIRFGDNVSAHDINIKIMPAASINLQSGLIDYRNAS